MRNHRPDHIPHETFDLDPNELNELLQRKLHETDRRLARELNERCARLKTNEALAERMSQITDVGELAGTILATLRTELGARHGVLALVNDDRFLEVVAATQLPIAPHQIDWLEETFVAGERLVTDGEDAIAHSLGNADLPAGVPLLGIPLMRQDGLPLGALYLEGALRRDREDWLPELVTLVERALQDCQHYGRIEGLIEDAALAIATAHEAQDLEAEGHIAHVEAISDRLAEALGLGPTARKRVKLLARLHDVSVEQVRQSFSVLQRSEWTRHQWEALMADPFTGGLYPSPLASFQELVDELRFFRARYDGRGNSPAVSGAEIPLSVRVVGVAEAFEKLTVARARRTPVSVPEAIAELRRRAGSVYDPLVVEALAGLYAVQELELRIGRDATDAR